MGYYPVAYLLDKIVLLWYTSSVEKCAPTLFGAFLFCSAGILPAFLLLGCLLQDPYSIRPLHPQTFNPT